MSLLGGSLIGSGLLPIIFFCIGGSIGIVKLKKLFEAGRRKEFFYLRNILELDGDISFGIMFNYYSFAELRFMQDFLSCIVHGMVSFFVVYRSIPALIACPV